MKKILYVISSLEDSGPVKVLYNIILNVDKKRYDIYVLALSCAKKNDLKSDFESLGVNVHVLNISRISMFIYGHYVLNRYLKHIKPDIVHTQCFRSTVFMQCFGSKVKLCTTIHCIFYQDFVFSYGRFIGWIMTQLYANALKKYDVCMACSETVEKLLSKKYILNLNAVRNGTQIPTVKRNPSQSIIMKKRLVLGITENKKMFICAGVICARKNQVQILLGYKVDILGRFVYPYFLYLCILLPAFCNLRNGIGKVCVYAIVVMAAFVYFTKSLSVLSDGCIYHLGI